MSKQSSLVCYIGNGVVKAAIVADDKKTLPTILTSRVREIPYQEFASREQLESKIIAEFGELLKQVKLEDLTSAPVKGYSLKDACVILSSPWYVSETKIVKVEHEKAFEISDKLIKDAIQAAGSSYLKDQSGIVVLEQNILRCLLNGYPTQNPMKKVVNHLELSVFLSFSKTENIQTIKQMILSHFHIRDTSVHSQSLAAFSAVRDAWKDLKNFVIADVTSVLTELVIVRGDTMAEAASFPNGKQFIVKELGKKLNTNPEVSQSLLRLYKEDTLDEKLKQRFETALDDIRKDWLQPFTKALGEMTSGASLPSRFILFAPRDATWLFSDFIKSEEYQQFTFSEGKFEVIQTKADDFNALYNIAPGVTRDSSLAIASIFHHKGRPSAL